MYERSLAQAGTSLQLRYSLTMGRKKWFLLVGLICLAGGGYLVWSQTQNKSSSKKQGAKPGTAAVPVSVAKVTKGNIGEHIDALGAVTPVYTVTVTSRVVGQLVEVDYKEGQMVKKGDLLAVIDPKPYTAVVLQAQGQLSRDQALLKNAYIDLNRYKQVIQQHAIPEQQLATQQATVEQDEGTVKLDEGNLLAAQVNVDYTRIIAPIDGRVGLRLVDPGNIVAANGTAGLLVITQIQPITVIFTMAEDYVSEVVKQMQAGHTLTVDALDRDNQNELAKGTLLTIDNQIDATTGTVKLRAEFANRDNKLFPNEFVNARLLVRQLSNVNLIPDAAIQRNNDVAYVYVVQPDSTVKSQNVKIQTNDGTTSAVTGVEQGAVVVTDGFDKLQDGTKVAVKAPAAQPSPTKAQQANQSPKPASAPPANTKPQSKPR